MNKEPTDMNEEQQCMCSAGPTLIFACSGAADVGELSDRAARKMTRDRVGRMFCLAGVGGRVDGIMKGVTMAGKIVAIDGCSLDCTKHCLEEAGFHEYMHMRITDLGMEKGKTAVTDETVARVAAEVKEISA